MAMLAFKGYILSSKKMFSQKKASSNNDGTGEL